MMDVPGREVPSSIESFHLIDDVQRQLSCCGVYNKMEWYSRSPYRLPRSCCSLESDGTIVDNCRPFDPPCMLMIEKVWLPVAYVVAIVHIMIAAAAFPAMICFCVLIYDPTQRYVQIPDPPVSTVTSFVAVVHVLN